MTATAPEAVFTLSDPQYEVFADPAQFRVLVAGRRFGKTHLAAVLLLESALENPGSLNWYTAQTFKNARVKAWPRFKQIIPRDYRTKLSETDLTVTLTNGSRIVLVGREEPDNLRGDGLRRIVNDEFAANEQGDKGKDTWESVLLPMLADTGGDAVFITTPKGLNWGYELYERGQSDDFPEWRSWQFTTIQGGRVPRETVERFRAYMDPRTFRQELEATFEGVEGRVYDYYSDKPWPEGNVDGGVRDQGSELIIGMDFNVDPMTYVVMQRVVDEPHVLAAVELSVSNTEEVCQDIRRRYPNRYVVVCPDPSARQRRTSAALGVTDLVILRRNGFHVDCAAAAPAVVDRVNNTQSNILTADGKRRLHVHPDAMPLRKALGRLTRKGNHPDKDSPHIHITDALGYALWQRFNLMQSRRLRTGRFTL